MLIIKPNISIERLNQSNHPSVQINAELPLAKLYLSGSIPWQILVLTALIGILIVLLMFFVMYKVNGKYLFIKLSIFHVFFVARFVQTQEEGNHSRL